MLAPTLSPAVLVVTAALTGIVSAHGWVGTITANGVTYPGWSPLMDSFEHPVPARAIRPFRDNGPVDDYTSDDIVCGNVPDPGSAKGWANVGNTTLSIPVKNGDKLTYWWETWITVHPGPVMTYIANCNGDCKTFRGNKGNVWVKIDQVAFDKTKTPPWGTAMMTALTNTWTVTVPPKLTPGEYVIRHEPVNLLGAKQHRLGTQFYPSCARLSVTGDGTQQLPEGIALPGAYSPDDTKGVDVYWWQMELQGVEYVAPGGEVWSGAAPQLNDRDF